MAGQVHWLSFIILLVAVTPVIALYVTGRIADRRYRVEQRQVRCRATGNKLVECTVVRDAATSEPIGIRSCSAHPDPEDVRCGRDCLPLFAGPAAASKQV
jgi:hypothetical protein